MKVSCLAIFIILEILCKTKFQTLSLNTGNATHFRKPKSHRTNVGLNLRSNSVRCNKRSRYSNHTREPVYWINLDESIHRKNIHRKQLLRLGFTHERRISAVTPPALASKKYDKNYQLIINKRVVPAKELTDRELGCTLSHLIAIYRAVHDDLDLGDQPFALITEDDVIFELDANFTAIANTAPPGFGIIQFMTSHVAEVVNFWKVYKRRRIASNSTGSMVVPWKMDMTLWSTQAYLINKRVVKSFIDRVVHINETSKKISIDLVNPAPRQFPCGDKNRCYLPFKLVSDFYIYLGCGPAYFSMIPLFNGARVSHILNLEKSRMI